MNIIFSINGGIGKCVIATAVCRAIKKQHPEDQLIVVSGYPEVFLNNPYVDRAFAFGNMSYFYQDFIEDKAFRVFVHDPYVETDYLKQDEHLSKTWCRMFGIEHDGTEPEIFLTERENTFFASKFSSDKPILLLQTNGGAPNQDLKYSWARDIPSVVVSDIIRAYESEYNIVHMRREDQIAYNGTTSVTDNFRALCVLISLSEKRLLMDSFGHHAAAALNKPSTVLWIANTPVVFGHEVHNNIVSNPFTKKPELRNAYLQKFDIAGNLLEFPYNNETEIFNIQQIIDSLK
jgi:hypothetical protein